MHNGNEFKKPRTESSIGKELFVGLNESESHQRWIAKNQADFDKNVKNCEIRYAPIPLVTCKTLCLVAKPYTGELFADFESTRGGGYDAMGKVGAVHKKTLRLTLKEFEAFQEMLPWILAFIKKVQQGSTNLTYRSDDVSLEDNDFLGYSKKLTDDVNLLIKFKDHASILELQKGDKRFSLCAGGFEYYKSKMDIKVYKQTWQ